MSLSCIALICHVSPHIFNLKQFPSLFFVFYDIDFFFFKVQASFIEFGIAMIDLCYTFLAEILQRQDYYKSLPRKHVMSVFPIIKGVNLIIWLRDYLAIFRTVKVSGKYLIRS